MRPLSQFGDYINWGNVRVAELANDYFENNQAGQLQIETTYLAIRNINSILNSIQYNLEIQDVINGNMFIDALILNVGDLRPLANYDVSGNFQYVLVYQGYGLGVSSGGGTAVWGGITGTIASQIDLQAQFTTKEDTITESTTAKYWRGDKTFQTLDTSVVAENGNLYFTNARTTSNFNTNFGSKTTDNLLEGVSNLYFTDTRVRGALLTGFAIGSNISISAGDTILSAFGKTQGQINAINTASGLYLLKANNLSDVASASTSRTNLGLGTIATQNANAVAITGGTIDGTTVGLTTQTSGSFTTLRASTSLFLGTAGTGSTNNFGYNSGLTATAGTTGTVSVNFGRNNGANNFVNPFQITKSYNSSNIPTIFNMLDNGATILGAYDQLPVRGSSGGTGDVMASVYPTHVSATTSKYNELNRNHISSSNSTGVTTGAGANLIGEYTFQLNTIDFNSSGWYSQVASRNGFNASTGGFTDYYSSAYSYLFSSSQWMRIGADNSTGVFSIGVTTGSSTISTTNTSSISFNDASTRYIRLHSTHTFSASSVNAGFMVSAFANLGTSTVVTANSNTASKFLKFYNNNTLTAPIGVIEGSGAIRLASFLEIGGVSASGYAGASSSDNVRFYVRGGINDYGNVVEYGSTTGFLVGDKPNIGVKAGRVLTVNAIPTPILTFATTTNTSYKFRAEILAIRTAGGGATQDTSSIEIEGTYKNIAGTLSLVGTLTTTSSKDNPLTSATFIISATNLIVQVTGIAATSYSWNLNEFKISLISS